MTRSAPIAACSEIGRFGHRRERVRPGPDLLVVAQQVVRDLEHAEGGDTGREAREAHQRQADEERIDAADRRRCEQRRHVADRVVPEDGEEVLHDRRLLGDRHREHARRPGSHGDEADVSERDDARVPDEDVDGDDDRDGDERVDEVDLRRVRGDAAEQRRDHDEPDRAGELGQMPRRSYALHRARATGKQPVRTDEEDEDDEAEQERRQILALVRRQARRRGSPRRTRSRSHRASR